MKLIEYIVRQGDTLQAISSQLVGTLELTNTIALVNDLDYPFIDTSLDREYPEGVKVARMGDTILIPLEIEAHDVVDNLTESDSFGIDLALSTNKSELSHVHIGEFKEYKGDLLLTYGKDTLSQAIVHRLITEKGALLLHPQYGSDLLKIIGEKTFDGWEQKVILEITKAILSDPRVEEIQGLTFNKLESGIHVDCQLVTPLGLVDFSEYVGGALL